MSNQKEPNNSEVNIEDLAVWIIIILVIIKGLFF